MQFESYHWKRQRSLSEDYIHHFEAVRQLYEYDPWMESTYVQRAAWLDQANYPRVDRQRLVDHLMQYNRRIDNDPEALHAISSLKHERTLVVVGGQQAGLFTGPALVIYKAITLIQTAKRWSQRLNRQVVPVFWIAGEDHDFDEVNHIHYLSADLQIQKIKIDPATQERNSVGYIPIEQSEWERVLSELDESFMDTEFKANLLQKLSELAYRSTTLTDFFARLMGWLFGRHGLILLNSSEPDLREIEVPMFEQLIQRHEAINKALLIGKERVTSSGYDLQADVEIGQANLFYIHENHRLLLKQHPSGFSDKKQQIVFSEQQLLRDLRESPQKFSNNVFTRPLMQEYLFPVLATVLGPAEIAYWGLLREAFQTMGMHMPVIIPRRTYTLVEGTLQKHMAKYDMTFDDVIHRFAEKKQAWLDAQDTLRIDEQFQTVKQRFTELYDPILTMVAQIHAGMRKLGETNQQKILEQIDFLHKRASESFQSQFQSSLRQLERILLSILPLGKPQERVYNIFAYINKYGMNWLDDLIQAEVTDEDYKMHTIVYF